MKRLFTLFALLAMFSFAGCENYEEPLAQQTSALTLSFQFNAINNGESMTKTLSNSEIFAEFYAAICDGRLVAPSYDLTFTEVNTGESFQLKGKWNMRTEVKIKMGTYKVVGTATAEGEYIQDKCSIVINDPSVVIDRDDAMVVLQVAYDCALVIFNDESIASVVNYTGASEQELFEFSPYLYAFVNDTIWDGVSDSYLLGTRHNGSQFTIPTESQPFEKGKYYIYDITKTNSFESGFILPEMEEGKTGVVGTIGDFIQVMDVNYRGFTLDVEVPQSVKENNHMIKWGAADLYLYNKNKYGGSRGVVCNADFMLLKDDVYGQFFFNESTTLVLNEEESFAKNPDGTPNYNVNLYDVMVPGQPEVVFFGEFACGDSDYGYGYGYYRPMFDKAAWASDGEPVDEAPYWDGLYAKGMVVTTQPQEMGDHITSVDIEPMGDDATIRIEVDDAVELVCVAVYDEKKHAETMTYLDNNTKYRQWFATSFMAMMEGISICFASDDVMEVKLSEYLPDRDINSSYIVDIVALAGDYDGDGDIDGNLQHYETYVFNLNQSQNQGTKEICYTSTDGNIVTPYCTVDADGNKIFGANIISNTYESGKGVIKFDGEVTSIGDYAFAYCTSLASITIPESVTSIEEHAFYYCINLVNVTIPESVTSIEERAFITCSSLASITIPESVTHIGAYAFQSCPSLTSITIPKGVVSMGVNVFYNCPNLAEFKGEYASDDGRCLIIGGVLNSFAPAGLTEYTIPEGVTEIGLCAFYQRAFLTGITISDSVTSIGGYAFAFCESMTGITISDSVTSIGGYAFAFCESMTSVTIPEGVTGIGEQAFIGCYSLTEVTLPSTLTSLEYGAFAICYSLASVRCAATTPPSVTLYEGFWDAFYDANELLTIYVPTASVEAYKTAEGWSEYADRIVGYDF